MFLYCVSVSAPEGSVFPDVPEEEGDHDEELLEESEIQEDEGADSVAVGDGGDGGDDEEEDVDIDFESDVASTADEDEEEDAEQQELVSQRSKRMRTSSDPRGEGGRGGGRR